MSQHEREATVAEAFSEEDVAEFLRNHPDFFERHPKLLMGLKLVHQPGTATVSLVERQVAVLRQRNGELECQLKDLVAVAKDNHALVEKIHQLAVTLMESSSVTDAMQTLSTSLREDFLAERAVMVLFVSLPDSSLTDNGFVKVVDRDDPGLKPFASFLKSGQPRCGLLRGRQKSFAFEDNASGINSAALIPLGEDTELGFIVIGSQDPDYFNPGKGMDFLSRLGELVTVVLAGGTIVEATSGPNAAGS